MEIKNLIRNLLSLKMQKIKYPKIQEPILSDLKKPKFLHVGFTVFTLDIYLNNKLFLSRTYQLIVAPQKFHVLKKLFPGEVK